MSSHQIKTTWTLLVSLAALLALVLPRSGLAQSNQGTARKIVSDDFTNNRHGAGTQTPNSNGRPAPETTGTSSKPRPPKRTYRLASAVPTNAQPKASAGVVAQLGITLWRLRPSVVNDTGARMLIREKSKSAEWVPERVEADTIFREGDQIRLTIESPQPGYLYVVDRDLFADDSTGPAMLIYPWADMRGGDNRVGPGKLID